MSTPPQVDIDRLIAELQQLASFSDCEEPSPAVTRVVFTPTDLRAREYLASLYEDAGLEVRIDPIGNTFARWVGEDPSGPVVGTGSHTDAIPHSGMYDGTVGVLGGLEAIRALQRAGVKPKRSLELVMFTSEEPTRFGVGCTGSRMMAGQLSGEQLSAFTDAQGDNYDQVRQQAGFAGSLAECKLPANYYHAFVELHIEQGPELEASGLPIGVVTAIAAPAQLSITLRGEGGHAGAVLMPRRKDALNAAAEIISTIERIAGESSSPDLVATVGQLAVHPGAANSIPSEVKMSLDLRDINLASRDQALNAIQAKADSICQRRGIRLAIETLNADPPATCDAQVIAAAENSCRTHEYEYQRMISRAYHDSLFMAQIAPTGMIFIPCREGVSHRPDEYSSPAEIERGVQVLASTLAELAG